MVCLSMMLAQACPGIDIPVVIMQILHPWPQVVPCTISYQICLGLANLYSISRNPGQLRYWDFVPKDVVQA